MRLPLFLLLSVIISCTSRDLDAPTGNMMGYAPVYADPSSYRQVEVQHPKATVKAEKIYASGTYIFQVEQNGGIHIIADGQSKAAHKIAFLKIPFCTEVAVKGNYLYTNNLNDLVVFDISDATTPKVVHRLADAFPYISQHYPNVSDVYFECPDPEKGLIVRWEQKMLSNPKCRR